MWCLSQPTFYDTGSGKGNKNIRNNFIAKKTSDDNEDKKPSPLFQSYLHQSQSATSEYKPEKTKIMPFGNVVWRSH